MKNKGIIAEIQVLIANGISNIYGNEINPDSVVINQTKKEFEGDYTVVLFPFVKQLRTSPMDLGDKLSEYLKSESSKIIGVSLVSGFLNVQLSDQAWKDQLSLISNQENYGERVGNGKTFMVEFSSPNTNKPLHLGHIRNILLGDSCGKIYKVMGYKVIVTQVINDRGIAVCKSMYAWSKLSDGETPDSANLKGDHFVGKYYVKYNQLLEQEYQSWQKTDTAKNLYKEKAKEGQSVEDYFKSYKNQYFNEFSKIGAETKEMLLKWESGDSETVALWQKLNSWVYEGFDVTYKNLGVEFTKNYYESDTYKLGRSAVEEHLEKGLFERREDGSIWVNLEDIGMDKKILLRSDGTSLYITQDIGTANVRYEDFHPDKMVYVVGDEQDYHFKVLFEILKRMGKPYADGMYHLSYGMVDLPTGKMKSREGTIVDADDLLVEVIKEAADAAKEVGSLDDLPIGEQEEIFRKIGMGALKYQLIRINPRKRITFDPAASIDMQGVTGPYIQNAYVRIQSILRRLGEGYNQNEGEYTLFEDEKELLILMNHYPYTIKEAADNYDPSIVATFSYNLAKAFHRFYQERSLLNAESEEAKNFRIKLIREVAKVLKLSMALLGIEMPNRM